MDLSNKRVVVVGLAQTGVAVANFCSRRGAHVTVSDGKSAEALRDSIAQLEDAALDLGGHTFSLFESADLIVMSPGVPELDATRAARAAGVPVIAEIELAYRFLHPDAILIAITGTNGKSTTTALAGALCEASGRPTFCGGNLGNHPLIEAVDHPANVPGGLIVAEVAGFMLETCDGFCPTIGACLNITPDHLDRYGTFEVYASMKARIFRWQKPGCHAIANARDPLTVEAARDSLAEAHIFDSSPAADASLGAAIDRERGDIILWVGGAFERYPISDLSLIGNHNLENAMAAYLCARLAGVAPEAVRRGAKVFRPQKHRMEQVGEHEGVLYFDDSKGTNVAAVAASLEGFPQPVILIAGGVDKGGSYEPMFDALRGVAKGMVLIGQAADTIEKAATEYGVPYSIARASSMRDAVKVASTMATPGDAVVLSPACSSYDMYKNFMERGMDFRAEVARLK